MIKNYFKIAWRNLFRNKAFSITNLLGLIIGITCTMLIMFWVQDELTYDKFHKNYDNIYQVIANRDFKNQIFTDRNMVFPMSKALETGYPQIKNAVVMSYPQSHVLQLGDTRLKKQGYRVGGRFFDMFSWKTLRGNPAAAISDPTSIVLTQSTAKAFFGDADPLGKVLRMDNDRDFKITAVIADPPGNSTFVFDYIQAFNYNDPGVKAQMNEWTNSSWNVFLQLQPGASPAQVDKIVNDIKHKNSEDAISTYFTFPMKRWRLYSDFNDGKNTGGMIENVRLFSIIAVIILLIACINFMNLSTARSEKRAKEVGVRKTLGSGRRQLAIQFFFESMILAILAFAFSILAVYLLLPSFNLLVSKQLSLQLAQPFFWIAGIAIILFTGVVAGSYPALYLSSFNPIRVLKGTFKPGKSAVLPRRILVVGQFAISILLISATIIVYRQIQHVKDRDMGYNPNNLVMIPNNADLHKNYAVIKQELLNTGMIAGVTRSLSPVTDIWWRSGAPDYEGKPANSNIILDGQAVDRDYFSTIGTKLVEGKDFTGTPADSAYMILNVAAVKTMGLKNPVGMQMRYGGTVNTVIGVVENVVMGSPYSPVEPMMLFFNPDAANYMNIRLKPSVTPQKALAAIEAVMKKHVPAFPFEYQFVDEVFGRKFATEELIGKLTNIFAALGIFICCIGLAGLASFTIEKRFREIGIRKVMGASVQQLLVLISKEFLKLVLIAFVIAVPVTWYLMDEWLAKYEYRTGISIWLFGIVGVLILLLTMIVVSLNTIRAATANPVKSLRTE
jgi:ABC-type antimicrobial peptide transport system permease subunit